MINFLVRVVQTIMALRKEEFHHEDERQEVTTMKRSRITIDISPELRRRIKVAASQRDLSISEYLGRILEHTNQRIFEDSTEIIRQMREERSQELDQL